jgi:UDP-GlcNAc:undecaprenyl-phosphate GlcNAc-1-phosphate transferase
MLVSSLATFLVIHFFRTYAIRVGLTDNPDSRRVHTGSVPLIGGIAMYCGVLVSILVTQITFTNHNYFILITAIIIIIGVLDDHKDISVSLRILFQVLVSIITVTLCGVYIGSFGSLLGSGDIILNEWGYFVAIIAIIGGMNAVNMTDGAHGMAGANSLVTFIALFYLSLESVSHEYVLLIAVFCSVVLVFLMFNLCIGISISKRIFMGDVGSMFIGFTIVWLLIVMSKGEGRVFAPVTALWLFAMPLLEMSSTILRRLISGKSLFKPDLNHTHNVLARLGLSVKNILLLNMLVSTLMAVIGILGEQYEVSEWVMFFGFVLISVIYVVSYHFAARKVLINSKLTD